MSLAAVNFSLDVSQHAAWRQKQAAAALGMEVFFCDRLSDETPAPALAFIPAGQCIIGAKASEYQAQACEMPQHEVTFSRPFALTQGTIRRREYNQFLLATGHKRPRAYSWVDEEFPVFNVSIKDAMAYAVWLSEQTRHHYRVPTEAEWEYAARADTQSMFYFGDKIRREEVNCSGGLHCTRGLFICGIGRPVRVGALPPNAWGLREMHGNMQEFTLDHWRDSYRSTPRSGDNPFKSSDSRHRHFHVVRGGSWFDGPGACRSASRSLRHENEIDLNLGFRLLRELY